MSASALHWLTASVGVRSLTLVSSTSLPSKFGNVDELREFVVRHGINLQLLNSG